MDKKGTILIKGRRMILEMILEMILGSKVFCRLKRAWKVGYVSFDVLTL